jgi:hypothetical protein
MNNPSAPVARAIGTVGTTFPPIVMTIGELALKPIPIIWTVFPTLAVVGVKVIVGTVRLNVAFAAFPDASVIVNVFVAIAVSGIANVVESAPVAVVVVALRVTAMLLTFAVTALSAANPVPVAVIVVPLLPVVGLTSTDGVTVIAD